LVILGCELQAKGTYLMMIIMHPGASKEQIDSFIAQTGKQRLTSHPIFDMEQVKDVAKALDRRPVSQNVAA
jgi:hypothetical protein